MTKKFHALRIIATIYKIVGVLVMALTLLSIIAFCLASLVGGAAMDRFSQEFGQETSALGIAGGLVSGLVFTIIAIFTGGMIGLQLFAAGENISLMLAVEENTRAMVALLQKENQAG